MSIVLTSLTALTTLRVFLAGRPRASKLQPCLFGWVFDFMKQRKVVPIKADRYKFCENFWYFSWHLCSTVSNFLLISKHTWFKNCFSLTGFFNLEQNIADLSPLPDSSLNVFLQISMGFWLSCFFFVFLETKRKDFAEMAIHHFFTVALIGSAYLTNQHRVSSLVLIIHDVVDIFLYLAKTLKVMKFETSATVSFVLFTVSFFVLRLVHFPIVCILSSWYTNFGWMKLLPLMLAGLYVLHLIWFKMVLKVIQKTLKENKTTDVRSEEENEDEDSETETERIARKRGMKKSPNQRKGK
jgi:TLC domain